MGPLREDQSLHFPSGASFVAPKGWHASRLDVAWLLRDPEHSVTMALLEIDEPDVVSATRQAWRTVAPDFSRELFDVHALPNPDVWDRIVYLRYETAPSEKRMVHARARGKSGRWYVSLLDGAEAGVNRRLAQLRLISQSFLAPDVVPEDFAGRDAVHPDRAAWESFAEFVDTSRKAARVPGVAVAVVQDGAVVFESGLGVRETGQQGPVTPRTLFAIGSLSKQLTTLMMARLVERGVFDWDTPVLELKPDFRLGDDDTLRRMTLRHTVSASTGFPRQDMEFAFQSSRTKPEDVLVRMSDMRPTTGFGEVFQYSNTMVAAGGYLAAQAFRPELSAGEAFDRAMTEEVFGPLRMHDTTTDLTNVPAARVACPHRADLERNVRALPLAAANSLRRPHRPSAGVWSSARDLGMVLLMELSLGQSSGPGRYLSEPALLERRRPQIRMSDRMHYALGLMVGKDCGLDVVSHNGGTAGFASELFFLPNEKVGAVMLANLDFMEAHCLHGAIPRRLMELWFRGRDRAVPELRSWLEYGHRTAMQAAAQVELRPDESWPKSLVGTYEDPRLGRIRVDLTEHGGVLRAPEWDGHVGRKVEKDGMVKVVLTTPPEAGLELVVGEQDGQTALIIELPQQRYVFSRVAA